jgi:hypothetical protein
MDDPLEVGARDLALMRLVDEVLEGHVLSVVATAEAMTV